MHQKIHKRIKQDRKFTILMLTVIMAPTVPNIIIIILTDSEEEAELQSMIKSDEEKNQNVLFDPCIAGGGVLYNSWSECSLSIVLNLLQPLLGRSFCPVQRCHVIIIPRLFVKPLLT